MKRITVRFVAAALAVGVTLLQLTAIGWIAAAAFPLADPVMVLPRVVVTPA
jgi:hypothetical protein